MRNPLLLLSLLLSMLMACSSEPSPSGAGGLADLTDPDVARAGAEGPGPGQPDKGDTLAHGKLDKGDYAAIQAEIRCLGEEHTDRVLKAHDADRDWLKQVGDRVAAEDGKQARISDEIDAQYAALCPDGKPTAEVRGRLGPE